jgi:electron transfer flavoprotein beta subunit
LDIVVCIKQVPDPEQFSKITLDPVKGTIQREKVPPVINPLDRHALEEGLKIRERFSGKLIAISMGPPQAKEVLESALAMGADEAILLCDRAFAGADTLATAYPLADAIQKLGKCDLIFCGNETVDGATGQVGPQLAELLGVPHITYVSEIEFTNERSLIVKRAIEYGYLKIQVELPILLSVIKDINRPRLPTVQGIMEAMGKEIRTWGAADIKAEEATIGLAGSPTQVIGSTEVKTERKRDILEGSPEKMAEEAVKKLRELEAI